MQEDLYEFEERAAILEFDAGLSRLDAEKKAREMLDVAHARHRQDRKLSIAMNLADLKTKDERDAEVVRIKEKYPKVANEIIALAKKLYDKNSRIIDLVAIEMPTIKNLEAGK